MTKRAKASPARARRPRWPTAGTVVRIPLSAGRFVYALVLRDPFIRFLGPERTQEVSDLEVLRKAPVLFEVSAHDMAIHDGRWPIVGNLSVDAAYRPAQFMQDEVGCEIIDGNGVRTATIEQCKGLEAAMIWEPGHVESRLADHFAGRENPHVKLARLRMPGEPPWPH